MTFKLLQWNIWFEEELENVVSLLEQVDADVICLQELTVNSKLHPGVNFPVMIAQRLKLHSFFKESQSWERDGQKEIQGNGIFSKQPILETDFKFLREGVFNTRDFSKEGRVYLEVKVRVGESILLVGTTHLSYTHKFKESIVKEKEVSKLLDILQDKKGNFVFTGDLNAPPDSSTIKGIEKFLRNCGPDCDQKSWTTKAFNYNDFKENHLNWRLDYVFGTEDMRVKSARILETSYSDHLPILVELDVRWYI
jgi:endonuclease/exonuclease/phosphatase family metal-dependent hydrolase